LTAATYATALVALNRMGRSFLSSTSDDSVAVAEFCCYGVRWSDAREKAATAATTLAGTLRTAIRLRRSASSSPSPTGPWRAASEKGSMTGPALSVPARKNVVARIPGHPPYRPFGDALMRQSRSKFLIFLALLAVGVSSAGLSLAQDHQGQLSYSKWTRACIDGQGLDLDGCMTGIEGRGANGELVVAAVVADKPILRVNVALGMQIKHGTQLTVGENPPMERPYLSCRENGCISDYALTPKLRAELKSGKNLIIRAIDSKGALRTWLLPLAGLEASATGSPETPEAISKAQDDVRKKLPLSADYLADPHAMLQPALTHAEPELAPVLHYESWAKVCTKGTEANATPICFTGSKGVQVEPLRKMITVVIIEPEGDPNRLLRVTVPLGMQMAAGTSIRVDSSPPLGRPYVICLKTGCASDYELTPDLLNSLRNGQSLLVQVTGGSLRTLTLRLPLGNELGKAYDGPPTSLAEFEASERKFMGEMSALAMEAHNKAQATQPADGWE